MKKKKYIKPDITIIPMDDEIMEVVNISSDKVGTAADDTKAWGGERTPEVGGTLGHEAPEESKKNQMWDLWEY